MKPKGGNITILGHMQFVTAKQYKLHMGKFITGLMSTLGKTSYKDVKERVNAINFAGELKSVYFDRSCQNGAFNI